jgi:hypothetical protein
MSYTGNVSVGDPADTRQLPGLTITKVSVGPMDTNGPDLVLIGLQSPVVRNRNMSLNVLKEWPPESWPHGARELTEGLAAADPNEKTRALAADVRALAD